MTAPIPSAAPLPPAVFHPRAHADTLPPEIPDSLASADSLRAPVRLDSIPAFPDTVAADIDDLDRELRTGLRAVLADSMRVRFELGASADYTNEIYYLDSLATPTLTERQRYDTAQTLGASVALLSWDGTRAGRATTYSLSQEIAFGDRVRRGTLLGRWRQMLGPDWRWLFFPRAEYRKDRTLGRDLEEYQASGTARLRRDWNGGATALEWGLHGDWLHSTGSGAGLLADRWSAATTAGFEHSDFSGLDGRIDYTLRGRVFPDSTVRDHLEHETQARLRFGWGLTSFAALELQSIRRFTVHLAPTSLDNFWEEAALLEIQQNAGERWGAVLHLAVEAVQFDLQDEVLYFDHEITTARAGPRFQPSAAWFLEAGPHLEWLATRLAAEEAYREIGGYVSFEAATAGLLWTVTPSAGRREYAAGAPDATLPTLDTGHSSYGFLQIDLLGDQRIAGVWRARAAANGRWEFHDDSVENGASLYFSLDVRRLF